MDYVALRNSYVQLLDGRFDEQVYQDFFEEYPEFLPREFIQNHGIHHRLVLRKVPLGNEHVSDFLYMSKSSGDWNIVIVELEKPHSKYFKPGSLSFHAEFSAGLQQINRWRAWLAVPANQTYLLNSTLGFLRVPLGDNPCHLKYVLVTGRAEETRANATMRRIISSDERSGEFAILSYDSLAELDDRPRPLYVGALRKDCLDVVSSRYSGESLFSWVSPDKVNITDELRADCLRHRAEWHHLASPGSRRMVLDENLDKLGKVTRPERKQLADAAAKLQLTIPL